MAHSILAARAALMSDKSDDDNSWQLTKAPTRGVGSTNRGRQIQPTVKQGWIDTRELVCGAEKL